LVSARFAITTPLDYGLKSSSKNAVNYATTLTANVIREDRKLKIRKLSVADVVDEIMTEMTDGTFRMNATDRISFRDLLIQEIKDKLKNEEIEIVEVEN